MKGLDLARNARKLNGAWLASAVVILVCRSMQYAGAIWGLMFPDSNEYLKFHIGDFIQGNAMSDRPPVYPIFLHAMEKVFGEGYLTAVVWVQVALSMMAVVLFAKTLANIGVDNPWRQLCTTAYACTPATTGWDTCILTESFSLSLTVAFFYSITKYLKEKRLHNGISAIIFTAILIFLRPQFLTYWAILVVFCVLRYMFPEQKEERKHILKMAMALILCGIVVLMYSFHFQKQFGIFSLTAAKPRQDLVVCGERGYYVDFDDPEITATMLSAITEGKAFYGTDDVITQFGYKRAQMVTHNYFAKYKIKYVLDTIHVMMINGRKMLDGYAQLNVDAPQWVQDMSYAAAGIFQMGCIIQAILLSIMSGVIMVIQWIRYKKMPWLWMAFFSILFTTTVLTFFITCGEYMRTMISSLPYLYCIIGLMLQFAVNFSKRMKQKGKSLL